MKWLATVLCLLAISATASEYPTYEPDFLAEHPFEQLIEPEAGDTIQEPFSTLPRDVIMLPSVLTCGPFEPNLDLVEKYGERSFVIGFGEVLSPDMEKSYQGIMEMYLDPIDKSWTVVIHLGEALTCLVITGEALEPTLYGEPI